ncbi:hypothetical protein [Sulfitobacter sabulilitoris]|uniref:DUF1521 domain-containing protein n=1 Tax=Sulfitobacter sabulilitoris TaxID=2562655 RepID=A0A5S3PC70_9RHOB|nr:hypothetical protein [Sulfitobacter sabulilitoris]TMM51300.1 hypothetical protein FDT80_15715 [Sulfitobacter sabulilitoris]
MAHYFRLSSAAKVLGTTALGLMGTLAQADQQILDDLIVDGSACIGQDCVNGESFGFDTLRLKENNLRIKAQDTSSTGSFPTNDWQLTFNDSSNGGQNKFSIDDIDGGRTPFTIEASAPSNSLYVEDSGQIGLGTSNPVVEAHIVDGDSPTIRLEQDGSSGFTPQTWDIAGNETNFFVRDVTNGSRLPFKIKPSAPTNSLFVNTNGDIGFGTQSPQASVHLASTDGTAQMRLSENSATQQKRVMLKMENKGDPAIEMGNSAFPTILWEMRAGQRFIIDDSLNSSTSNFPFDLSANGDLILSGSLTTGGSGACSSTPCDAVFDPEVYTVPSIAEHAKEMWQNKHLPAVGPTLVGDPINMTEKMLRMLNELEHAHIYIEQLHGRVETLETALNLE